MHAPEQVKGYLLLGTAAVACPCHVPILLAVLAGTSLGGLIADHAGLVVVGLSGYFILALALGFRSLDAAERRAGRASSGSGDGSECSVCPTPTLQPGQSVHGGSGPGPGGSRWAAGQPPDRVAAAGALRSRKGG